MNKEILELANLIDACLRNEIQSDEVADKFSSVESEDFSGLFNETVHYLYHFSADEDIRIKDPEYDAEMKKTLLDYSNKLKAAART